MAEPKDSDQVDEVVVVEKPTAPKPTPPQPARTFTRSGNFVVLNKHNLSQFKKVKCIPASNIRKIVFSRGSVRCSSTSGRLSSIDSKPRFLTSVKSNLMKFKNITRLSSQQHNQHPHTNGESKNGPKPGMNGQSSSPPPQQKSGILIKRNHMKNIPVRKVNVVQSNAKRGNAITNGFIDSTMKNNNSSINSLIADLEN